MTGASINVSARTLLGSRLPRLAMLALLSLVLTATAASGQYCTPDQCDECNLCTCSQRCCHELPEMWLVNTRCAPRCSNLDCGFDRLIYKRYDRKCCRWVQETRESFLAQEATMPTLFYVHGNSLNHKNAMKGFWQVYCKMRCCPGKKRLVCWSWPAERVYKTKGLRVREMIEKNLRIKYVYAEYQGYYMAKLVNQMSLSQRVMMSGHSYGGITSSAAAHLIGGGCLRGLTLAGGAAVERPNLRAAVISGAFDHDMLNPGNRYGQAFVAAEKIFVTRNVKDSTLKKWPKTSWRGRRAIGVIGVNANCLGEHRNKLCQKTMTADVGKSHYLKPHLKSVRFVAALCCLSFPQCNTCLPMANNDTSVDPENDPENLADSSEFEVQLLSEEQLDAQDDQLTYDEPAEFDFDSSDLFASDVIELAAAREYDPSVLDTNQTMLTASYKSISSINGTFAPESTSASTYHVNALATDAYLADINGSRPASSGDSEASSANQSSVAATKPATQPVMVQPTDGTASDMSAQGYTAAGQIASSSDESSNSLWYQGGLCLAIVLTGQFYVLFSRRPIR